MSEPRKPYRIQITTHDADNQTAVIDIDRTMSAWVTNQVIQALFYAEENEDRYYNWRADRLSRRDAAGGKDGN